MLKLTHAQYNDFEDEFLHRIKKRIELGHCTQEAATRQEFGTIMEKLGAVEPVTRIHYFNPNTLVKVKITDEDIDPKDILPSYGRFF